MMPRLECFRGASNCGLISASRCIGAAASDNATGSTALSEMKLTSITTISGRIGRRLPSKLRISVSSIETILGWPCSEGCNWLAPDIDRKYQAGAVGEQHLGEAAGRCADVEADMILDVERIALQRAGQLDAAARDIGMRRLRLQHGVGRNGLGGFHTGLSLAMTRPASIAACARARLSNRPRSTSNRSARLRGGGAHGSRLAKFNPMPARARGKPLGGHPHAGLESGQVMPDIGGRLPWRHQRAAVQIERMDHHQIVGQSEILDGQSLRIDQAPVARSHLGEFDGPRSA